MPKNSKKKRDAKAVPRLPSPQHKQIWGGAEEFSLYEFHLIHLNNNPERVGVLATAKTRMAVGTPGETGYLAPTWAEIWALDLAKILSANADARLTLAAQDPVEPSLLPSKFDVPEHFLRAVNGPSELTWRTPPDWLQGMTWFERNDPPASPTATTRQALLVGFKHDGNGTGAWLGWKQDIPETGSFKDADSVTFVRPTAPPYLPSPPPSGPGHLIRSHLVGLTTEEFNQKLGDHSYWPATKQPTGTTLNLAN